MKIKLNQNWLRGAFDIGVAVFHAVHNTESSSTNQDVSGKDKLKAVVSAVTPIITDALQKDLPQNVKDKLNVLVGALVDFNNEVAKSAPVDAPRIGPGYSDPPATGSKG